MTSTRPLLRPFSLSSLSLAALVCGLPLTARAQGTGPSGAGGIHTEAPVAPPGPALTETPPAPPPVLPTPPPPVPPQPESAPVPAPAPAPAEATPAALNGEPLAGVSDGNMFLRAPDNSFVFFPSGRLQIDTYLFHSSDKAPNETFLIRRARLELAGWIGGFAFFHLAGDFAATPPSTTGAPVAQANLNTTDNFVGVAPWGNIFMLQVGQYDAPFTLENRTSDKYFDFMERSITVRAFGISDNKAIGAMAHGFNENRNFMYSIGVFNGDGQNFKNADRDFDVMGRAWVAPFSFGGPAALHDVSIGGSGWTGNRANTLPLANQTTQGGFTFLSFAQANATVNGMMNTPVQLRQVGRMNAVAGELNVPVNHRYGVRSEVVWRHSPLSEENVTSPAAPVVLGGANLTGWSTYGELWFWALGDDTIIGDQQGLEPFPRYKKFGVRPVKDGLMLAFRFEVLDETITEEADAAALGLGLKAIGQTKVNTYELGINYWHSKRFRATFNYVYNHFSGTTAQIKAFPSPNEQEFLFRFGIAL